MAACIVHWTSQKVFLCFVSSMTYITISTVSQKGLSLPKFSIYSYPIQREPLRLTVDEAVFGCYFNASAEDVLIIDEQSLGV